LGGAGSGPGQFNEQVGLAFDRSGNLYVADTWNGRIQKFGPDLAPLAQFPVPWTSQGVLDKPYITVLSDNRIVASNPGDGNLMLLNPTGAPLGKWSPGQGAKPIGVAATPDGGFVFTDTG